MLYSDSRSDLNIKMNEKCKKLHYFNFGRLCGKQEQMEMQMLYILQRANCLGVFVFHSNFEKIDLFLLFRHLINLNKKPVFIFLYNFKGNFYLKED